MFWVVPAEQNVSSVLSLFAIHSSLDISKLTFCYRDRPIYPIMIQPRLEGAERFLGERGNRFHYCHLPKNVIEK